MSYPSHYINARQSPQERADKYAFVQAYGKWPRHVAGRARDWTWGHIYVLCDLKPVLTPAYK